MDCLLNINVTAISIILKYISSQNMKWYEIKFGFIKKIFIYLLDY